MRPATILPPPLAYVSVLLLAWWLERRFGLPFDPGAFGPWLTATSIGAGLAIMLWSAVEMWRHRTTVNPYRAASSLVTTGPFRYSRNPIYLADWLIYVGVALWLETWWAVILVPLAWAMIRYLVIAHEEAHLEAKFGDEYRSYKSRVGRWLGTSRDLS